MNIKNFIICSALILLIAIFQMPDSYAQQVPVDTMLLKEVIITGTKIPQYILESPVTISKIDSKKIQQIPSENFYAGIATQKGVSVITNGLFNKALNQRGFSGAALSNEGMLELVDGMDLNAPGQGFSLGNLTGTNDIDVEKIELIPGAASAIYGDNAFNGLIITQTKDPFRNQGINFQLKSGCNYIDGKFHSPAWFNDYQLRYAKSFKDKFAFKINFGYLKGTEWMKTVETDFGPFAADDARGMNNPARDLANVYGDESFFTLPIGPNGTLVNVSRTGWNARYISQLKANNIKADASLHYRITPKSELSYSYRYRIFDSDFGEDSWHYRDFSVTYHKVEFKSENYFLRSYYVKDHDGNSYEGSYLAQLMNSAWKSDSLWLRDYKNAFNGLVNGVRSGDHEAARNYADIGMPQPGSDQFNTLFNQFKSKKIGQGGAHSVDESTRVKVLGQYDFKKIIQWIDIITGFDFGWRKIYTEGTMALDYPPPFQPIHDNNISGYIQLKKYLLKQKLNLTASLRADKYSQFDLNKTPRIAAAYQLKKNNFLRASFQTGTQCPDPFFQYTYFKDGNYQGVGGSPRAQDYLELQTRSFSQESVESFISHVNDALLQNGNDTAGAIAQYSNILKPIAYGYLQPQRLKMFELGYQAILLSSRLHIDIDFYYSIIHNMICVAEVEVPAFGNPYNTDSLIFAANSFLKYDYFPTATGVNSQKDVLSGGLEAGIDYNFYKNYFLSANFTYVNENLTPDFEFVFWVHSPKYKSNISFMNENVWKHFGFTVNWKWTDAVPRNKNDNNPHINNNLSAKHVIDAQISYTALKINTLFRIGASNLLNHYYLEAANGPSIGGLYYFSIAFGL